MMTFLAADGLLCGLAMLIFGILAGANAKPSKVQAARAKGERAQRLADRKAQDLARKIATAEAKAYLRAKAEFEAAQAAKVPEPVVPPSEPEVAPEPIPLPEPVAPPEPKTAKVRKPAKRSADPTPAPVKPAKVAATPAPAKVPATPIPAKVPAKPAHKREAAPIKAASVKVYATDGKADEYARILAAYATECAARRENGAAA